MTRNRGTGGLHGSSHKQHGMMHPPRLFALLSPEEKVHIPCSHNKFAMRPSSSARQSYDSTPVGSHGTPDTDDLEKGQPSSNRTFAPSDRTMPDSLPPARPKLTKIMLETLRQFYIPEELDDTFEQAASVIQKSAKTYHWNPKARRDDLALLQALETLADWKPNREVLLPQTRQLHIDCVSAIRHGLLNDLTELTEG